MISYDEKKNILPYWLNDNQSINELNHEVKVGKHYKMSFNDKIGHGGFGQIYLGHDLLNGAPLAVKVEAIDTHSSKLKSEAKILNLLQGGTGIPALYAYIEEKKCKLILMELLGKNINTLFKICKKVFSLKTVLTLSYQMINRIEYIHSKYIIHRDIKPENFLLGKAKQKTIYLIDYGCSKLYMNAKKHEHIPFKEGIQNIIGTERYCSIYTHLGKEQSRRDDIESFVYVMIYLLKGKLPWMGIRAKTKREKVDKIKEKKLTVTCKELCDDYEEVWELLNYAREMRYEEEPDYKMIKNTILEMLDQRDIKVDNVFEWEGLDLEKEEEKMNKKKKKKK